MKKPRRTHVEVEDLFDEAKDNNDRKKGTRIKRILRQWYVPMKEKIQDITEREYSRVIWVKPKIAA